MTELDRRVLDAWLHSDQPLSVIASLWGESPADLARRIARLAAEGRCGVRRDLHGYYQRSGGVYAEREAGT